MTIRDDSGVDSLGTDPLAALMVIDRLEVGPPRLTESRLAVSYRVVQGSETKETELVYRWEEGVFHPDSPSSRNLAAVIAAQVALNYGLFCRKIILEGSYDKADRSFLADMLENTSREIFVKKLLQENPFLVGAAVGLTAQKRERYTQAELIFEPTEEPSGLKRWDVAGDRWAVLSSGGKDSLTSFGLLRELGQEVHPIYLNESGRHWMTALNAYRHFREGIPHTARVWTNSDRVFNWMLRCLPFIRADFQRVRADIYPLRLWTVAVFLVGALPLMRKRRIGRLVIGDEYDTTVRARHQGIPHHDGLYDQSLYFDHAVSRYFAAKGWGVTQGSLLRPLSELLIEKTLALRFPDLARLQVSCHSAHKGTVQIEPCGRCEKCRRIVAMLLAVGVDPGELGYTSLQVERIVGQLAEAGLHQERAGVEHLGALLKERGHLPQGSLGGVKARPRPEVEKLRFHPEISPIHEVPIVLRRRLYGLLLEVAGGSLRREGREWIDFDVLASEEVEKPYRFDPPDAASPKMVPPREMDRRVLWGGLTWPEAEERLKRVDIALLPVGAIEQHGHHLPLDVDTYDAERLAREVAEACTSPRPLVLPVIPYGVSYHHEDFAGTLSITNETLARLVYEVGMSAARQGVKKLVMINGHGGNAATLSFAAQMINRDGRIFTCVDSGETSDAEVDALTETPNDVHAGEIETSTTLALRPEVVRMELAQPSVPQFSSRYLDFTSRNAIEWHARTARFSPTGVMGDPTKATREKGEVMWRLMTRHLVELVEHLKELSLDEIYEQRT